MAETAVAIPPDRRFRVWRRQAPPGGAGRSYWQVAWSGLAAARALRVTVVAPGLLALCLEVIGNPQMALYATFGAFATLVMASFGGSRRDKAVAHLGLAVVGSVALTIGTLVSGTTWLAALVTVAAGFAIFFGSSVTGRNAAARVTAALIAYLLPVLNAGTASEIRPGWPGGGWRPRWAPPLCFWYRRRRPGIACGLRRAPPPVPWPASWRPRREAKPSQPASPPGMSS